MPINPNIALGIQPVQQPNMLGQMGQVMALRAASQEIEGNEALREFYASGGDTSTAEGRRQLMARTGAIGSKIIGQQSEIMARDVKTQADSLKAIKDNVGSVNSREGMIEYLTGAYSTPGGALLAKLVPLDKAIANIPTDPKGLEDYKRNFGSSADRLFESADAQLSARTSLATTGMTTAATRRGQDLLDTRAKEGTWSNITVGRRVMQMNSRTGEVREVQDPYDDKGFTTSVGPITTLPDNKLPSTVGAAPSVTTDVNALRNPPAAVATPPVNTAAPISKTRPPVTNPLMVEEKPVWNDKAQVWMTPPTDENPQGKVVEAPNVQEAVQKRTANATLKVAGYDPKTGTNEVSNLIKESTSGLGENWANKVWSAITGTGSKGAEAIGQLETRANEMTLALAPNGSLGAGFSNEDRLFMLGKLGDVANPNKPMNVRLAAWEDVMERTARNAGVPYTKQALGSATKSSPKVIQFGELPK
jgi:hypothetical protein